MSDSVISVLSTEIITELLPRPQTKMELEAS